MQGRRARNLPKLDLSEAKAEAKTLDSSDSVAAAKLKELYEFQSVAGYGRTSLVRKAARRSDGQEVALKCSIEEIEGALKSTVQSEFELMKTFAHETILAVFDVHVMPHSTCICSEWCCDGCLESYLSRNRPYTETAANLLGKALLHGISYLHGLRVVHRDIKPSNLLLKDGGETLKIGDFGSAKEIGNRERASAMLSERGSSLYSAPELKQNLEWNERVDVWSAGLCMYFMTQAALPSFVSNPDTAAWVEHGQPPDLELQDQLSNDWQVLLAECLTIDSKERPPALQLLQHQALHRKPRTPFSELISPSSGSLSKQGACAGWKESRCGWTSFREVSDRNSARHFAHRTFQESTDRALAKEAVVRAYLRWARKHESQAVPCLAVLRPRRNSLCRRFTTATQHNFD